jgi:hypothetical protein
MTEEERKEFVNEIETMIAQLDKFELELRKNRLLEKKEKKKSKFTIKTGRSRRRNRKNLTYKNRE